mgnify:CR=1 FL=1
MYHPRLQGTHYEMGLKYGTLLYRNGIRFDNIIQLSKEQQAFGLQSLSLYHLHYPEIMDEIRGMSEGLRYPFEPFACFLLNMGVFGEDYGCTCICFKNGADLIFARNHDMFSQFKKLTESCLVRPTSGYTFVGQGDALVGKEDGVNEHGLAVGMTFVAANHTRPGFNFLFIVRYLLEKSKTVEEAIALLHNLPICTSQNIILADRHGDMAVVECCSEAIVVRKPKGEEQFLVSTNHFIEPIMLKYDGKPEQNWYLSETRYHTTQQALRMTQNYPDSILFAQQILSGKLGFVCQYKKELNFDSLWSFIVRLNDLTIVRSEGNPSTTKYSEDTRLTWAIKKK